MKLTTKQLRQLIRESIRGDMDFQTRGRHDDVVPSELDKFNREEQAEKSRQRAKITLARDSGDKAAIIKAYTNAIASGVFKADEEEDMRQMLDKAQDSGKRKAPERDYSVPYSRKLEAQAEADLLKFLKSGAEGGAMDFGKYRPESLTAKLMQDFKSDWKKGKFESTMDWIQSKTAAGQYAKKPGFFGFQESLNITSEQLKQMIREEFGKVQEQSREEDYLMDMKAKCDAGDEKACREYEAMSAHMYGSPVEEGISEVLEMDTDVWSIVENLKLSGMTESGMMIELDKMYTAGAAGPDAARQWGEWMSYAGMGDGYRANTGDLVSWQQQRGAAGLVEDLKKVAAARGARV